jgi:hypothetical protein
MIKQISRPGIIFKIIGLCGVAAWMCVVMVINLGLAHFRETSGAFLDGAGNQVVQRLIERPFNPGKQAIHALFFFSFVIFGFAVLSIAKIGSLTPILLVAMSAALMSAYAFCIAFVPATKLRLDVAGDNMYYLGFLYTLSSLAVAITISEAEQILANFGVAISSTIFGIAARVAFNQMRIDPHDIEAASRVELSEATRRVTDELNETITQLTQFRTLTLQVLAEGYEDVQKNVENAAREMFQSLKETSDKNALILVELGKNSSSEQSKLSDSILNLKSSNEELVSANRSMVSQMSLASAAYQALANRYSETEVMEGKIIDEVKGQLGEIQSSISRDVTENLVKSEKTFEENIVNTLNKNILEQSQELKDTSLNIVAKLQDFVKANSDVSARIEALEDTPDLDEKRLKPNSQTKKSSGWFRRK